MDAEFLIRNANPDDYDSLCELFGELDVLHSSALPQVFREPAAPLRSRDYIAATLEDRDAAVLVAETDGQVVGAVHILIRDAPDNPVFAPRLYAWVESLGVRKGYRGRGVGRALMEMAQLWARERGATQCELNVWEFNRGAIGFYEGIGYETASRRMWRKLT